MSIQARDKFFSVMALYQQGRLDEAEKAVRLALKAAPQDTNYLHLGGLVAEAQGRLPRAVMLIRQAHELRPDMVDIAFNLARVLSKNSDHEAAIRMMTQLTASQTNRPELWETLAKFCALAGRLPEALTAWEEALKLAGSRPDWRGQYLIQRRQICLWDQAADNLDDLTPQALTILSDNPALKLHSAQIYAQQKFAAIKPLPVLAKRSHQKIRLGYLSCDFYNHATAYLMAELFELHDRSQFEVFIYNYGADDNSPIRKRIIKAADHFIDIGKLRNQQTAERIQSDHIDILIDLKGYTRGERLEILAYRPAPIQMHWLGFPGTLGTDFIDYFIADAVTVPPEHEHYFSEKILRLPDCYQINDRQRQIAAPLSRTAYGLPEAGLVLASFNQTYKITPELFAIWCQCLRDLPDSCLWLFRSNSFAPAHLQQAAKEHGIDPNRLIFAEQKPLPEHLARYTHVDLALDTFPVVGHTTTSDALWAATPVVALMGNSFVSRVSASLLTACGLEELITTNLDAYRAKILQLARDPAKRAAMRQRLQDERNHLSLFDTPRFVKNFEALLLQTRKM